MIKYKIESYFSEARIDLKMIDKNQDFGKIIKRENSFLLYKVDDKQYIYFKDYGGLAFFNVAHDRVRFYLELLVKKYNIIIGKIKESLTLCETIEKEVAGFDELVVAKIDSEIVHISCLNMAQSAALFHYQSFADNLLENTRKYTNELEQNGKVSMKRKQLMKHIGTSLNIKNKIAENLHIFETPHVAWKHEHIHAFDIELNEELELKSRYRSIEEKLNIVQENLEFFKDINLHEHSSKLEWIIIWLIVIEVIHMLIDQIGHFIN